MKKEMIIGLLFWFQIGLLHAQVKVYAHLDRLLYATGETVYGSVFSTQNILQGKVIEVQFLNDEGTKRYSCFSKFNHQSVANFYYQIAQDVPTGKYKLCVSICKDKAVSTLITGSFVIVNPLQQEVSPTITIDSPAPIFAMESDQNLQIEIERFPRVFHVSIPPVAGCKILNIAVIESHLDTMTQNRSIFESIAFDQKEVLEWEGRIFVNGVVEAQGKPSQSNILGIYANNIDQFLLSKSNAKGEFVILVDSFLGQNSYQLFPYSEGPIDVKYAVKKPILGSVEATTYEVVIKRFAEDAFKRSLISRYFESIRLPEGVQRNAIQRNSLTTPKTYLASNYSNFESLIEFCRENYTFLHFKAENEQFRATFEFPPETAKRYNVNRAEPLFIVDGFATRNADQVARIKFKEIVKFEIFFDIEKTKKRYPVYNLDGIVRIETRSKPDVLSNLEKASSFVVEGFQRKLVPLQGQVMVPTTKGAPYFSPILFWMSPLAEQAAAKFEFAMPSDEGPYTINVLYLDQNQKLRLFKKVL